MARLAASISSQWRGMREALASLLFPAPCRICGRMLDTGMRVPFCHQCVADLTKKLPEPFCRQCGRPIASAAVIQGNPAPQCYMCRQGAYAFDIARSYGAYSSSMARAVLMLKYNEVTPLVLLR